VPLKQSLSSKIRESKLWHIKEQFGRGLKLAATSAFGHVIVALASAAPELDSTPINKLTRHVTDDMRSFVFDGAVRSVLSAYNSFTYMVIMTIGLHSSVKPVAHCEIQKSPAIADKPARRESLPKIAPIRRAYNVVADDTGLSSFV